MIDPLTLCNACDANPANPSDPGGYCDECRDEEDTTTLECGCVGKYRNGAIVCKPCDQHPVPFYSTAALIRLFAPARVRNLPLLPRP